MHRLRVPLMVLILIAFALVPVYCWWVDSVYPLTLFGRILVFALAALGLNLALGFGGMVSLGHAMYIGFGAYAVGIGSALGLESGALQILLAMLITALIAAPLGWIALRTQGIAFIMITLAFAQLFYYVFISLRMFGGDDGMTIQKLSAWGALTGNKVAIYLSLVAALVLAIWGISRTVQSRFGLVLRATMVSERRVNAVGTPSLPYRLAAYVISAELCAVAGYFLANLTSFVSPAYMAWTLSGELIVMALLGGSATVFGPVVGALALLLLEEGLKAFTDRWALILGPIIVLIVVFLRQGIWGLLSDPSEKPPGGSGGAHG
ncbi:MAG: branched-chain amino acid ABC transporter permease [Betaproteobacteria bacterium]|nr:branched-chain amino acid ABC transporter permease [Betaproteobacteria bacterium]